MSCLTPSSRGFSIRITVFAFIASVAGAALAQDRSWIERSDRHSAMVFETLGAFYPEWMSEIGVERFDGAVMDRRPGRVKRIDAALATALKRVAAAKDTEKDVRVRADLDLVIDALERIRRTNALEYRLLVPYDDLPRQLFEGLRVLLDERNPEPRRRHAIERLRRYAGLEPGSAPAAQLARERTAERAQARLLRLSRGAARAEARGRAARSHPALVPRAPRRDRAHHRARAAGHAAAAPGLDPARERGRIGGHPGAVSQHAASCRQPRRGRRIRAAAAQSQRQVRRGGRRLYRAGGGVEPDGARGAPRTQAAIRGDGRARRLARSRGVRLEQHQRRGLGTLCGSDHAAVLPHRWAALRAAAAPDARRARVPRPHGEPRAHDAAGGEGLPDARGDAVRGDGAAGSRSLRVPRAGPGGVVPLRLQPAARAAHQGRDRARAALRPTGVPRPHHRAGPAAAAAARACRDGRADSSISRYFQNSRRI